MNERIVSLLCNDDVAQYQKEFPNNDSILDRWVRNNVMYVAEHCPDVYHLWSTYGKDSFYLGEDESTRSSEVRARRTQDFFLHVARNLQSLSEKDRLAVLKGRNANEVEKFF